MLTESDLYNVPTPVARRQCSVEEVMILATLGPIRPTYLSRFWTIPAHRNPIARRVAALGAKAGA